jgi:AcrR family transcriptional regulator
VAETGTRPFHRGLDRDAVLQAALVILDRDGREALTMRRLAHDLDVQAASLYTHVRSKDDLIDAVLDRVLDSVPLPNPRPDWRRSLIAGFVAYRKALVEHPAVVHLITERARTSRSQIRLVERSIELLEAAGLTIVQAVETHVTLVAFTLGFIIQEVGRPADPPRDISPASDVFPRAITALATRTVDQRFRTGLDLILDGAVGSESRSA